MSDIPAAEVRLSAYWDALVLCLDTSGIDVDPELADAVRQFQALGAATPSTARERVWQRLESLANEEEVALHGLTSIGPATTANGHPAAPGARGQETQPRPSFGRWVLSHLATAALLILTLAAGFAAIWQRSPTIEVDPARAPALIRALDVASGGVNDELLVEATFTPDELPIGETEAIFYRITLPPGISLRYLAGPFCVLHYDLISSGVGAEVVQTGTYSLRLDAPFRVQRDGATSAVDEIPAGTEVVLDPGNTAIYPDYTAQGTIRNVGDEPVVITGVVILDAEGSGVPAPKLPVGVKAEQLTYASPSDWRSLPTGPVTVSLWRLTLPEGTSVGPYEEAFGLETLRVEDGGITRNFLRPGESTPLHLPLFHPAGTSASFVAPKAGVRRTITNVGNEPAVVLALSIEPAGIWSGTLTP